MNKTFLKINFLLENILIINRFKKIGFEQKQLKTFYKSEAELI